jgi:GntR family transcriptional regulator
MRQAVQLLTRENLVVPRRGVGTIVREHGVFQKVSLQTSLQDLAQDYEHIAPVLLVFDDKGRRPSLPASAGPLKDKYIYMQRLHLVDGEPCAVISLYLAEELYRRAPDRFRQRAVISVLAELNAVDIRDARQTLTIDSADAETSRLLRIAPHAPVGRVERIFRDTDGAVVYTADLVYRGDWVKWEVDLQPPWRDAASKKRDRK